MPDEPIHHMLRVLGQIKFADRDVHVANALLGAQWVGEVVDHHSGRAERPKALPTSVILPDEVRVRRYPLRKKFPRRILKPQLHLAVCVHLRICRLESMPDHIGRRQQTVHNRREPAQRYLASAVNLLLGLLHPRRVVGVREESVAIVRQEDFGDFFPMRRED